MFDRFHNSWAILPAAQCLFNKSKVTLDEIATQWKDGTVVVCRKPNGQFGFIAGSMGSYGKLGQRQEMHHDQTGGRFGIWTIVNEIQYETVDGKVKFKYAEEPVIGTNMAVKASMAVFK